MRHAILATHIGERITPAQLKAELLEKFPSVKPQSVNAPDCFYSDANARVPECGRLGGFAVNRDGIVDMRATSTSVSKPLTEVNSLGPNPQLLIALHSPYVLLETGLRMFRPEKSRDSDPFSAEQSILCSPVC
jgi:hypothetical protein